MSQTSPASYGSGFNAQQGGVYAMQWTSNAIKTFFFPRGSIPSDITSGTPNPDSWTPVAVISNGDCNIDNNFKSMRIIFDTTFCGDFGDATWNNGCAARTGFSTCAAYVASRPGDFAQAYWQLPSLKVYTLQNAVTTTTSSSTTQSSTTSSYTYTTSVSRPGVVNCS